MTQFAGTLTGAVTEEQVFVNNQWVTYRIRGGSEQQDAFFAPTTKTPYTDDVTLGYQVDLGRNMSFETTYTNRRTRDVLEDYDLTLYADHRRVTTTYPGNIDAPGSLWLGLDYFGYDQNPGSNFVIGTLEGGKRDYHGVDLIFRKRYSDNWQALAVVHLQPTPTATRTRIRTPTSRATCSSSTRARRTPTPGSPGTSRTSSSSPART